MYTRLHVQYPLSVSDFDETLTASTDFRKVLKYQISRVFAQYESSCSMPTDGRPDREKDRHNRANSRLSQFANAPENCLSDSYLKINSTDILSNTRTVPCNVIKILFLVYDLSPLHHTRKCTLNCAFYIHHWAK